MLRQLRETRGERLQSLARRAGYSLATLSQIERGKMIPIPDTAKKFMALLDVDDDTRKLLLHALDKDRAEAEEKKRVQVSLAFGDALRDLLKRLDVTNAGLIRRTGRPASSVNAWIAGTLLPSDETLVEELMPKLRELAASEDDLQELELAHFHDLIAKCLDTRYITEENQVVLLAEFLAIARCILSPAERKPKKGRRIFKVI